MKGRGAALVLGALVVAGCKDDSASGGSTSSGSAAPAPSLPELTDKMPSSVSAERGEANAGEDPKADFKTFKELYKEQDDAVGKSILFRGFGTPLKPGFSHLSECKASGERANILQATFADDKRDLMRAMPSNQFVQGGKCPRVHVKITGFHKERRYPQGEIVEVYDLQPDPPPKSLPGGVDFVSIDDVFLAGPAAVGKVADFGVSLGGQDVDWKLNATGCSPHGGWNAHLFVAETDANRDFFASLKKEGPGTCVRVRAKITKLPKDELNPRVGAELIGVGQQFPKPHPPPNP